jgi:hypothetical protein
MADRNIRFHCFLRNVMSEIILLRLISVIAPAGALAARLPGSAFGLTLPDEFVQIEERLCS